MDQITRRQQQSRSNSISGHDLHSNGGYHRLKYQIYAHQSPYIDGQQQYFSNQTNSRLLSSGLYHHHQQQQNQIAGRSTSPLSLNNQQAQQHFDGQLVAAKYQSSERHQPRNYLHASLECLNSSFTENGLEHQNFRPKFSPQDNFQHQTQFNPQNQHYATSYVLATPPANTIVNQNGDQDLAAAAMGNPPQSQYQLMAITNSHGPYIPQSQLARNHQISQSPMRRIGVSAAPGNGILSQLSNSNHPIRAGHSSLSLASSSFLIEDKLQHEIKKLMTELKSEREKNEALNSQLNINSNLMAAFEQSLTTLNTRLRQLTTLNEKKDEEIAELREQLKGRLSVPSSEKSTSPIMMEINNNSNHHNNSSNNIKLSVQDLSGADKDSEQNLKKIIEDLRKQLIEKDRLLTDTRLEALSAAHQLEQLESRLNGEHSILVNEDDLDEGVMVVNHSPSDSDAITDSAHFSEINSSQVGKSTNHSVNVEDMISFTPTRVCPNRNQPNNYCTAKTASSNTTNSNNNSTSDTSEQVHHLHQDDLSNHSSDFHVEDKALDQSASRALSDGGPQQLDSQAREVDAMDKLMDNLLVTN